MQKKNEDHREQETKGIGSKLGKKLHRGENPKKYPLLIEWDQSEKSKTQESNLKETNQALQILSQRTCIYFRSPFLYFKSYPIENLHYLK